MFYKSLAALLAICSSLYGAGIELSVSEQPLLEHVDRIGVNLGTWTTWGAEQLSKNVLMNPGFEGDIDRVVVIVQGYDASSFFDEANWGYEDNYWNGATFEVRSGTAKGTFGKITHSLLKGANGLPQYVTEKPLPPLHPKDVIVITKIHEADPVPIWWIAENQKDRVHVDTSEKRPLSPGSQSLSLEPQHDQPAEINFYLDAITDRAGKLLKVNGRWKFSIWARTDDPDNTLHVLFRRLNGRGPFFDQTIPLTGEWQEHTIDFEGTDNAAPQTLQLMIAAAGNKGKVWIDDAYLGPVEPENPTNFRQVVVDLLHKLKPSYIRDTQGQLGDTLQNRLADLYARKAVTSRAYAGARSLSTLYSIPDLVQLCQTVGAKPWIVVPPTFNDEEALLLGQYLGEHANKEIFPAVAVEFGNENWNWLFRATGIPYAQPHGLVADSIFHNIEKGADNHVNLLKVINGQYASSEKTKEFALSVPDANIVAIAPYFFNTLNEHADEETTLQDLFNGDDQFLKKTVEQLHTLNRRLAVYEVNLHTTKGNAPEKERDLYTASRAAGSALAKRLIEGMLLKLDPEIVFSLVQYDSDTWDIKDKVKLWGITRDLNSPNHLRPQGLAMMMLNEVIDGSLHSVTSPHPEVSIAAFYKNSRWQAAAVNASGSPQEVALTFPVGAPPTSLWAMESKSPFDTNEEQENVKITKQTLHVKEQIASFTIPPYTLVILKNEE